MDPSRRKELEKFALERLNASAYDRDRWSYAWGRKGSVCLSYCMWSEHDKFDGFTNGLENVWSKERFDLIEAGGAEPSDHELRQWRDVMCRRAADAGDAYTVWIVPVMDEEPFDAFAVFMGHYGSAPEDPPWLKGVIEGVDEARAHLAAEGVISDRTP